MSIYTKILATTLPLVFFILFATVGITYHFSRTALTELGETWLETRLSEAMKIIQEQEEVLHRYGLEKIKASNTKAQLDAAAAIARIEVGQLGYIFAVNKSGIITLHPNKDKVGNDISNKDWFQLLTLGKEKLSYKSEYGKSLARIDYFAPWEWFVLATDPEKEVYGVANRMKPYIFYLVIFSIILFSGVLMLMTRRLTAPLRSLTSGADAIGRGDLETRITIRTRDELGRLAAVFNQMSGKLKKTLTALKTREEHFRALIENASDIITTLDSNGRILYVSPSVKRILNYSQKEMIGNQFSNWIHPGDREAFNDFFNNRLNSKNSTATIEIRFSHYDGSWRILGTTGRNLLDHNAVNGFVFNFRDITKQKLAQETLRQSHQELEKRVEERTSELIQANRQLVNEIEERIKMNLEKDMLQEQLLKAQKMEAIGTLAGGIAHDFNNILMGIQGHLSIMLVKNNSNHTPQKRLAIIQDYVENAANLTKQLLGFARLGKYSVQITDVNRLIIKSSDMFGRTRKELRIRRRLQRNLWAVKVDPGQIEQVLLNLFINGWHSMPTGGDLSMSTQNVVLDEIAVRPYQILPGNYVKISVTDTGEGMEQDIQQQIFDPFFTTKPKQRGTGLGLASVYGIIRNHDGFINVSSAKGIGTTFTIFLKGYDKKSLTVMETKEPDNPLTGDEALLFVDDEPMIIETCKEMMEDLGYEVFTADSGRKALEIYQKNRKKISLVILDMVMPDMNGSRTFDCLKAIHPDLKVLLASGYSLNGQAKKILKKGCNGFIQKPFNLNTLSVELRRIIDG